MGLIVAIFVAILAILAATASRIIADDVKAWTPWVIRYLIRNAVQRLREDQRARFAEEWTSHVNEVPGEIGKLLVALGFLRASWKMAPDLGQDLPFAFFKRVIDLSLSSFAIVTLMPLMIFSIFLIRAESPGPSVSSVPRLGYKNKTIRLFKFRTCSVDDNSAQVTLVGTFLRRTSLDVLPQILNVFLGDVSLVGPRPRHIEESEKGFHALYDMKPGITGMAQITQKTDLDDTDAYDVWYAENRSILLDMKIILWTLTGVVLGRPPH